MGLNFSLWKIEFTNSISLLDTDQFRYFHFFWILLEICIFHGICPFHVSCHIYWHKVVHNITLLSFNVYGFGIEVPLSFLILIICVLSFKEIGPAKIYQFYRSFQRISFPFIAFLYYLPFCYVIDFHSTYYFLFINLFLCS